LSDRERERERKRIDIHKMYKGEGERGREKEKKKREDQYKTTKHTPGKLFSKMAANYSIFYPFCYFNLVW
jgi:hypothetical protein